MLCTSQYCTDIINASILVLAIKVACSKRFARSLENAEQLQNMLTLSNANAIRGDQIEASLTTLRNPQQLKTAPIL